MEELFKIVGEYGLDLFRLFYTLVVPGNNASSPALSAVTPRKLVVWVIKLVQLEEA